VSTFSALPALPEILEPPLDISFDMHLSDHSDPVVAGPSQASGGQGQEQGNHRVLIDPDTLPMPEVPPETRATLAALERSDALERRASKRYSSYTFNKLPGSSPGGHKKAASAAAGTSSPQRPTRRADRPPPLPPLRESMALQNLASSAGAGNEEGGVVEEGRLLMVNGEKESRARSSSPSSTRSGEMNGDRSTGSVRIVKTPEPAEEITTHTTPRPGDLQTSTNTNKDANPKTQSQSSRVPSPSPTTPSSFSIFLQLGRQVKKAQIEVPFTLDSAKLLFMEKFEFDPGRGDFPNVYIRDPRTGVQYELEDMDDVGEGTMLGLDIERE
jgi:hypothetical protein